MTEYKPITKSIKETVCNSGERVHVGETEDGDFQLHFYIDGKLKIVKKCYHKNDALYQHERYLSKCYTSDKESMKALKKRVGIYETIEFTPAGAFDPGERRTIEKLLRVIETPVYIRKGKEVINYKNKVFQVHKNNVPMAINTDAYYIFNLKTDLIDTKNN